MMYTAFDSKSEACLLVKVDKSVGLKTISHPVSQQKGIRLLDDKHRIAKNQKPDDGLDTLEKYEA